jgi:hypothetical protein
MLSVAQLDAYWAPESSAQKGAAQWDLPSVGQWAFLSGERRRGGGEGREGVREQE